jgi:hypothetical protein
MGLDRASGHIQLSGNFSVVATFEQQIGNLLLSWTQMNGFNFHDLSSWFDRIALRRLSSNGESQGEPAKDERLSQVYGSSAIPRTLTATCAPNSTLPAFRRYWLKLVLPRFENATISRTAATHLTGASHPANEKKQYTQLIFLASRCMYAARSFAPAAVFSTWPTRPSRRAGATCPLETSFSCCCPFPDPEGRLAKL